MNNHCSRLFEVVRDVAWLDVFLQRKTSGHVVVSLQISILVHYLLTVVQNDVEHDQPYVDVVR